MVELREKLVEHGVTDSVEISVGSVPDISPEDLGELMGDNQTTSGPAAEAPGMSIEDANEDAGGTDEDNSDDDLVEDEE